MRGTIPEHVRRFAIQSKEIDPDPVDLIIADHRHDPNWGEKGTVREEAESRAAKMRTLNAMKKLLKEYLELREKEGLTSDLAKELRPEALASREEAVRAKVMERFEEMEAKVRSNLGVPKVPDLTLEEQNALLTKLDLLKTDPALVADLVRDLVVKRDLKALKAVVPVIQALQQTDEFKEWEMGQPMTGSPLEKALEAADLMLNDTVERNVQAVVEEELETARYQMTLAMRTVIENKGWGGIATRMQPSPFAFYDDPTSEPEPHAPPGPPQIEMSPELKAAYEARLAEVKAQYGGDNE
jgi:hypothetical protein